MKHRLLPVSVFSLLTALAAHAAPADDLAAATKKLADAPNYSWTSTMEMANSQFPTIPTEGVTEKGGYTVITRSFNGNSMQTVRKGTEVVSQNRDGDWLTTEELRAQFGGGGGGGGPRGGGPGGGGGRGGFGGGGMAGAAGNPAEAAAHYASKMKDLKLVDGALVATATGEEATALLAPGGGRGGAGGGGGGGGRGGMAPKYSSVTVKFWLKDGALAKYTTHTVGTFTSPNGDERELDTTTTVEIKNVGATKVEVPEAAEKKLSP